MSKRNILTPVREIVKSVGEKVENKPENKLSALLAVQRKLQEEIDELQEIEDEKTRFGHAKSEISDEFQGLLTFATEKANEDDLSVIKLHEYILELAKENIEILTKKEN